MKYWLLLLCNFFSLFIFAEEVPLSEARNWAQIFFQNQIGTRAGNVQLDMVWDGEDIHSRGNEQPTFYVFNRTDSKGFVIVSGEDLVNPLIGYSFTNEFKIEDLPENIRHWLKGKRYEINQIRNKAELAPLGMKAAWSTSAHDVGKVIKQYKTAKWNQGEPFNILCPIDEYTGRRSVTGCTATAFAIILRAHEWPNAGIGTVDGYEYTDKHGKKFTIGAHKLGQKYNWDKMPLDLDNFSGNEEKNQVAQLMVDCGYMVKSMYSSGETGGYVFEAAKSLSKHLQYSPNLDYEERNYYASDDWHRMLHKELNENGPIFYSGSSKAGGHAFVLDGYTSKEYFSVNWGWGGHCDGYYILSLLNPEDQGIGGDPNGDGFNFGQAAVLGLKKAQKDEVRTKYPNFFAFNYILGNAGEEKLFLGLVSTTDNFSTGSVVGIDHFCFINQSNNNVDLEWNIGQFNSEGELKGVTYTNALEVNNFPAGNLIGYQSFSVNIPAKIAKGDYLAGTYRPKGATEWKEMKGGKNVQSRISLDGGDVVTNTDVLVLGKDDSYEVEDGIQTNAKEIKLNKSFLVSSGVIINVPRNSFKGKISVGVFNKDNQFKYLASEDIQNVNTPIAMGRSFSTQINCLLQKTISEGDYLAICYLEEGKTWRRIKPLTDVTGKIILQAQKEEQLDKATSFAFDKTERKVKINTLEGVNYQLLKTDKSEISKGKATKEGHIEINVENLEIGNYELILTIGKQSKSLFIVL